MLTVVFASYSFRNNFVFSPIFATALIIIFSFFLPFRLYVKKMLYLCNVEIKKTNDMDKIQKIVKWVVAFLSLLLQIFEMEGKNTEDYKNTEQALNLMAKVGKSNKNNV